VSSVGQKATKAKYQSTVPYEVGREVLARYGRMMKSSRELFKDASKVLPGGVESNFRQLDPFPFYASRAKGSRLFDIDGNGYIDYYLSQGAVLFGHGRKEIAEAVGEQVRNGSIYALPTERAVEVAKTISRYVPSAEMVRFANSGTEATMHAIRVARGYTGRDKIAKPEGSYHGVHDYVLWSLWGPWEMEGEKLAAVIIEPVMGNVGCFVPSKDYLVALRKLCTELGIVLIMDEVVTGFRLARGGAQELFGVRPDLSTFGKALGGGFQMAAFGGRREVMEEVLVEREGWPTRTIHAGTYNAHPVSIAASAAALKLMADDRLYSNLGRLSERLFRGLQEACDDMKVKALVSHIGSMGHVYFDLTELRKVRDALGSNWSKLGKWSFECLTRGVMFGHPKGEKMFVSDAHTREDVDMSLEVAREGLRAIS
jgi:glutamate-1-semialdehyde 2,1-aminomutase